MNRILNRLLTSMLLASVSYGAFAAALGPDQSQQAAADYQQYCALCHGDERQGHVNDHAPSLRSQSLMESPFIEIAMATGYGRTGTPMAGFSDEVGGPLSRQQIGRLVTWLKEQAGVEESLSFPLAMIEGDVAAGSKIYAETCAECHGAQGEGVTGTALGNSVMLSLTTDSFLKHAITQGRDGTDMQPFGGELSEQEIDSVVAFIRSRASGWAVEKPVLRTPPAVEDYVLNPAAKAPEWTLKDDLYVMSADLDAALKDGRKMILLDTRSMGQWHMVNIEGSVPLPYYYEDFDAAFADLPNDDTWIVTYCECPRAAAEFVNGKLRERGFRNTAVLWEGIMGWVSLGYPVSRGESTPIEQASVSEMSR